LQEESIPFSRNRIITIEQKEDNKRTFIDCGFSERKEIDENTETYGKFNRPLNHKYQKKIMHNYEAKDEQEYSIDMLPPDFKEKLFQFQLEGVKFALRK
jgi:hypothetical protein